MADKKAESTDTAQPTDPKAASTKENAQGTQEPAKANSTDTAQTADTKTASSKESAPEAQETAKPTDSKATPTKESAPELVKVNDTEVVKTTESAIIFKATKPLMKEEFDLLSYMVKHENEKTGLKIVLMPFSCEVVEDSGSKG